MKHWLTAALICFGSTANALSVRGVAASVSTAAVTLDGNSNINITYGVKASTAVITYVQASSITVVVPSNGVGNAFSITNGTFTVANTGIVSAPSQPRAVLRVGASQAIPAGASPPIYWGTQDKVTQGMHSATGGATLATSSAAVIIPAGGGGSYSLAAYIRFEGAAGGTRQVQFYKNAALIDQCVAGDNAGVSFTMPCESTVELVATDYVYVVAYSAAATNVYASATNTSRFEVKKDQ